MSKNILIISKYFPPELTGSSTYINEIAHYLADEGFKVEVLTTFPHFPNWKVDPLYKGQYFKKEIDDLIVVTRVYSYIPKKISILTRILNELSFGFFCLVYTILKNEKYDVVFCISPPPSVSLSGLYLKYIKKTKFILEIRDLVLEALNTLHFYKRNILLRIIDRFEKNIYKKTDIISIITLGFKERLVSKKIDPNKIKYIPNWPLEYRGKIETDSNGLFNYNSFKVVYSGAIGNKDNIFTIIEAAKLLQYKEIEFYIIGDGPPKSKLLKLVADYKLKNVKFYPLQPIEKFYHIMKRADVLIVSYYANMKDFCLPSKILTYLSSGTCLIVLASKESEVAKFFRFNENAAILLEPENATDLSERLLSLSLNRNEVLKIGESGKKFVDTKFNKLSILSEYKLLINSLIN